MFYALIAHFLPVLVYSSEPLMMSALCTVFLPSFLRYKVEKQACRNSSELKKTCNRNAWRISLAAITALVLGERQTPSPYTLLSRLWCSHNSDPSEYYDTCR